MLMAVEQGGSARRINRPAAVLRFLLAAWGVSLASAWEYRLSLVSAAVGMFLNNGLWLAFWALYFQRFPVVGGWQLQDVAALWAVVTMAFGVMMLFGNAGRLPSLITAGGLDPYLTQPKPALLSYLTGTMAATGFGEIAFSLVAFFWLGHPTLLRTGLFLLTGLLSGVLFIAVRVIAGSLAFFTGGAQSLATQINMALVHFASYPDMIFSGGIRFMLYTVMPAAFIGSVPVELMRSFSWREFGIYTGGIGVFVVLAGLIWRWGLRRYESGNLLGMRG